MPGKRKDKRGRILRSGESQRKDGLYMFRFTDIRGKRHYVYAPTLDELRKKEKEVQRDMDDEIDYAAGEMTVTALTELYTSGKKGVSENRKRTYNYTASVLKKADFGCRKIKSVKPIDGEEFYSKLHADGLSYGTISSIHGVLRPAFDMAVENDMIRRNPFNFSLTGVIPNDTTPKRALTPEEKEKFLAYIQESKTRSEYYDEIVILLGTGMRISELYGLTRADIDFENRRIKVERQLQRIRGKGYTAGKPKTESSRRCIPPMLDDTVYQAFQRVMHRKRPKVEHMVDGCTGFLFLNKVGNPKVAENMETMIQSAVKRYNETHTDSLPEITPHIFRHTFATEMAAAGMNPKALQYILGHSKIATTLDVYAHSDYEMAEAELAKTLASR